MPRCCDLESHHRNPNYTRTPKHQPQASSRAWRHTRRCLRPASPSSTPLRWAGPWTWRKLCLQLLQPAYLEHEHEPAAAVCMHFAPAPCADSKLSLCCQTKVIHLLLRGTQVYGFGKSEEFLVGWCTLHAQSAQHARPSSLKGRGSPALWGCRVHTHACLNSLCDIVQIK